MADMKQYERRGNDVHEVRPDGNLGKRVAHGGDWNETTAKLTDLRLREAHKLHVTIAPVSDQAKPF